MNVVDVDRRCRRPPLSVTILCSYLSRLYMLSLVMHPLESAGASATPFQVIEDTKDSIRSAFVPQRFNEQVTLQYQSRIYRHQTKRAMRIIKVTQPKGCQTTAHSRGCQHFQKTPTCLEAQIEYIRLLEWAKQQGHLCENQGPEICKVLQQRDD